MIEGIRASMAIKLHWLTPSPPPRAGSLLCRIGEGDRVVWCLVEAPFGAFG